MAQNPYKRIFEYLAIADKAVKADVIIGFGHFDMKIPDRCLSLYQEGLAGKIIFTGGIGAGTADLGMPEAMAFQERLLQKSPDFSLENVIIEPVSTHTGENVTFVKRLIDGLPAFHFNSALIVASPYRQRRVLETCKTYFPGKTFINLPPESTYDAEKQLFQSKSQNLDAILIRELERLVIYQEKGFINRFEIDTEILELWEKLKSNRV